MTLEGLAADAAIRAQWLRAAVWALALLLTIVLALIFRNLQLSRAVRRQSQELEVRGRALYSLMQLGYTFSGYRDWDTLLRAVVHQMQVGLGCDRVGVYLIDAEGRRLDEAAGVDDRGETILNGPHVFDLDEHENPLVKVARGEVEQYFTLDKDEVAGGGARLCHHAAVPLRAGGHVLGVVTVDNRSTAKPFGMAELRQVRGYADEIALALYNARLLAEAEEQRTRLAASNRELQALVAFSRAANECQTPDEVILQMCATIREGFGFDRVGVFLKERDGMRGTIGTDDEGHEHDIRDQWWPLGPQGPWRTRSFEEGDYIYSSNAAEEKGIYTAHGKPVRHHLLLPLKAQRELLGVIALDNAVTDRPFDDSSVVSLVAFARQAATALRKVQLIEAHRSSEERLRSLVTSLSETLYSVRLSRRRIIPIYYSPQIQELTGYTEEEALATPDFWQNLTHPEDRPQVIAAIDVLASGRPMALEYRILHRNGQVRWVLDTPVPVRNEHGKVARVNGSILDITERKLLEERLRQAQKMETVGTLAGGIAHDFNNLLAIIQGNVRLAQMDVPQDHPADYSLSQAQIAIERAAGLVEQLLTFSRKTETRREKVYLRDIVQETIPLMQPSLGSSISLDIRTDPDASAVFVNPSQIQQVLINLCVNARDAMPNGGTIAIRVQNTRLHEMDRGQPADAVPGDYVRLQVRDTGSGMDAPTRERIFDPFFTTKPTGRGTGLGLAVAYAIIAEHRGWIDVKSAPGEGTLFGVYLPAMDVERQRDAEERVDGRTATILIVDADPPAREALASLLEAHGYFALTAENGAEALAIYWTEGHRIALVICSLNLTEMGVRQLAGHLRDNDPDVSILLAGTPAEIDHWSEQSGAPEFGILQKPYHEDPTLTRVRDAVDHVMETGARH